MATPLYWVRNGAVGNFNDSANWSLSSGGAGGAGPPTAAYDVTFDNNGTANCNLTANEACASFATGTGGSAYIGTVSIGTRDFAVTGAFLHQSGVVTIGGSATNGLTCGDFTLAGGTLTPSGASLFTASGNISILSGTYTRSGEKWTLSGSSKDLTVNIPGHWIIHDLTVSGSIDFLSISTAVMYCNGDVLVTGTFALNQQFYIQDPGTFDNQGTLVGSYAIYILTTGALSNSGTWDITTYYDITRDILKTTYGSHVILRNTTGVNRTVTTPAGGGTLEIELNLEIQCTGAGDMIFDNATNPTNFSVHDILRLTTSGAGTPTLLMGTSNIFCNDLDAQAGSEFNIGASSGDGLQFLNTVDIAGAVVSAAGAKMTDDGNAASFEISGITGTNNINLTIDGNCDVRLDGNTLASITVEDGHPVKFLEAFTVTDFTCNVSGVELQFTNGLTYTMTNLNLHDGPGSKIILQSDAAAQYDFDVTNADVWYCDFEYCDASASPFRVFLSTDSGNNTGITFCELVGTADRIVKLRVVNELATVDRIAKLRVLTQLLTADQIAKLRVLTQLLTADQIVPLRVRGLVTADQIVLLRTEAPGVTADEVVGLMVNGLADAPLGTRYRAWFLHPFDVPTRELGLRRSMIGDSDILDPRIVQRRTRAGALNSFHRNTDSVKTVRLSFQYLFPQMVLDALEFFDTVRDEPFRYIDHNEKSWKARLLEEPLSFSSDLPEDTESLELTLEVEAT